ncbi:sigma-70 family RNA polymerase sigma factor [Candidatus Gottesmanbacteria bacterium]|nr:sigma-70 family RNA polymerase sigma factor [Candidatus Gottesmanbacteria bacterium]
MSRENFFSSGGAKNTELSLNPSPQYQRVVSSLERLANEPDSRNHAVSKFLQHNNGLHGRVSVTEFCNLHPIPNQANRPNSHLYHEIAQILDSFEMCTGERRGPGGYKEPGRGGDGKLTLGMQKLILWRRQVFGHLNQNEITTMTAGSALNRTFGPGWPILTYSSNGRQDIILHYLLVTARGNRDRVLTTKADLKSTISQLSDEEPKYSAAIVSLYQKRPPAPTHIREVNAFADLAISNPIARFRRETCWREPIKDQRIVRELIKMYRKSRLVKLYFEKFGLQIEIKTEGVLLKNKFSPKPETTFLLFQNLDFVKPGKARNLLLWLKEGKRANTLLIEANSRLVFSIANKYQRRGLELTELFDEGVIGLMRGIDLYQPGRREKLGTYAAWWIRQAVTRAIENTGHGIRIPVHDQEIKNQIVRIQGKFNQEFGREPNPNELSEALGISPKRLAELQDRFKMLKTVSLADMAQSEETNYDSRRASDSDIQADDSNMEIFVNERQQGVYGALIRAGLSAFDIQLLIQRFSEQISWEEIGRRQGTSRQAVQTRFRRRKSRVLDTITKEEVMELLG